MKSFLWLRNISALSTGAPPPLTGPPTGRLPGSAFLSGVFLRPGLAVSRREKYFLFKAQKVKCPGVSPHTPFWKVTSVNHRMYMWGWHWEEVRKRKESIAYFGVEVSQGETHNFDFKRRLLPLRERK